MAITGKWKLPDSGTMQTHPTAGTISGVSYKNDRIVLDGQIRQIYTVVVHRFKVYDLEDPISYAADGLLEWENSEAGQWIMTHAVETPIWKKQDIIAEFCADMIIIAKLFEKDYTFWQLKWNSTP